MIDIDVSKIVSEIGEPTARLIENEEEKRQRILTFIFCSVFLFLLAIGTITFVVLNQLVKKSTVVLAADVANIQDQNQQYANVEKDSTWLQTRNRDTLALILNNPTWSYVFEKLEQVVPTGVTFSRFELQSLDSMTIAGLSSDYSTLSDLIVSMSDFKIKDKDGKDQSVFKNVALTNASLTKIKDQQLVDFSITFSFAEKISRESISALTASQTPMVQPETPVTNPTTTPANPQLPSTESGNPGTGPAQTPVTPPTPTPATPTPPTTPPAGNQGGLPVL